jgi:hypothetical protein
MVCRNLCERLDPKVTFGEKTYKGGKKYCRRCEIFLFHLGNFCPCCGMALRGSPTSRKQKEKLRINQLSIIKDLRHTDLECSPIQVRLFIEQH